MGPLSYMWSVVDRNVVMRRITMFLPHKFQFYTSNPLPLDRRSGSRPKQQSVAAVFDHSARPPVRNAQCVLTDH